MDISAKNHNRKGFSMAETIMAMFMVSLLSAVVIVGFSGFSGGYRFRQTTDQIMTMFARSSTAASKSGQRYGILFDFIDESFTLYEINTTRPYSENFDNLRNEDILDKGYFDDDCRILYIQFDDGETIDGSQQGRVLFVAGSAGWDYGGVIVLTDYDGQAYSIIINRLNKKPEFVEGYADIREPVFDMSF